MTYDQVPEPPIHRIREEFLRSTRDPAITSGGLKLADEIVATLTTTDREDARRLIKLVRDILDTLEPAISSRDELGRPPFGSLSKSFQVRAKLLPAEVDGDLRSPEKRRRHSGSGRSQLSGLFQP